MIVFVCFFYFVCLFFNRGEEFLSKSAISRYVWKSPATEMSQARADLVPYIRSTNGFSRNECVTEMNSKRCVYSVLNHNRRACKMGFQADFFFFFFLDITIVFQIVCSLPSSLSSWYDPARSTGRTLKIQLFFFCFSLSLSLSLTLSVSLCLSLSLSLFY